MDEAEAVFNKESMFSAALSQAIPFNCGILEYVNQLDLHVSKKL
jgi:hypothetical protein